MDGEDACMLMRDGANAPQHCARRNSATVARAAAVEEAGRYVIVEGGGGARFEVLFCASADALYVLRTCST